MALKYYSDYEDIQSISHRLEIYKDDFIGDSIEITADYSLEYPEETDSQEAVKPCGLSINLLASTDLSFNDLYNEQERVFNVLYIRDGVTLFNGWLSSDGLYESFVSDKWYLELSCIDGLGYLESLKYVENDTGLTFIGKQTGLEIITNCLKRTNLTNGLRTSIDIKYNGLGSVDVLNNIYFNTERFIKDDDETIMDCEEVLRSVLEIFNASITYFEGFWYVYRANQLFNDSEVTFYNYDSNGVLVVGENTVTIDLSYNVGSQVDGFYPHHVNGNQKKSLERSLGAYRLNLQYGRIFTYFSNIYLTWQIILLEPVEDWTLNIPTDVTNVNGRGLLIDRPNLGSISIVMTSDTFTVDASPQIEFKAVFSVGNITEYFGTSLNIKIKYIKGANTYWLNSNGTWGGDTLIQYNVGNDEGDFTLKLVSNVVPEEDGDIYMEIYNPGNSGFLNGIFISEISLQTFVGESSPQGRNYTIEKITDFTPKTNDTVKKVFNGDVEDGTYYATIYKNDEITETTTWFRGGVTEEKELLRIMIEDRFRMNFSPRIIFEGDYYGYVPYLTVLNINNVNGKFTPISYNYDSKTNVTSVKSLEILNTNFLYTDVLYSVAEDYGNVVSPTIKG